VTSQCKAYLLGGAAAIGCNLGDNSMHRNYHGSFVKSSHIKKFSWRRGEGSNLAVDEEKHVQTLAEHPYPPYSPTPPPLRSGVCAAIHIEAHEQEKINREVVSSVTYIGKIMKKDR
jgi:hypothetical protein